MFTLKQATTGQMEKWAVNTTPQLLYPQEIKTLPIAHKAGWDWTGAEYLPLLRFGP